MTESRQLLPSGKKSGRRTWRVLLLLGTVTIISTLFLFVINVFQYQYSLNPIKFHDKLHSAKAFLIKTPGCIIPHFDVFNENIKKYVIQETRPVCNNGTPALFQSNITSIFLLHSSLNNYNVRDTNLLKCCYQPFYRKDPVGRQLDNIIRYDSCIGFKESAKISHEFIKVTCSLNNVTIYTDFFSFVQDKKKFKKNAADETRLNVLIIGLDSVSRLNFYRQMPKTVNYLKNISAVEFLGYNKVADNTFRNLMPVLAGKTREEVIKECWQGFYDRFDKCWFVWSEYKKNGAVTSFGEDSARLGLFNFHKGGFTKQPTDYFWDTFNYHEETVLGTGLKLYSKQCVGAREVYKQLLDYIKNFVTVMNKERLYYFAFYWQTSLSHDSMNRAKLGDSDYYNLFKYLKESGHLNNTAMIVMSDHGMRFGDMRLTYQGRMEERLPFIYMLLPEWYTRQYPDAYNNLKKNSRRLTTPFDLHETLKDLINPFNLTANYLKTRYNNTKSKGHSLFSEISSSRTCEHAGIESHWCTCQEIKEADKNSRIVKKVAHFAVHYMNSIVKKYKKCAFLTLQNILNSQVLTDTNEIFSKKEFVDYVVTFQTSPGDSIFEATVRTKLYTEINVHYSKVIGTISRLNLYGQQSACIDDNFLKLYCYCNLIS